MATKQNEWYYCERCKILTKVHAGGFGKLKCCGADMLLVEANSTDAAKEKHVPVVEQTDDGIIVKVGEVEHPMAEEHYITYIEVVCCGTTYGKSLSPSDKSEVEFKGLKKDNAKVYAYCNTHGLWSN